MRQENMERARTRLDAFRASAASQADSDTREQWVTEQNRVAGYDNG